MAAQVSREKILVKKNMKKLIYKNNMMEDRIILHPSEAMPENSIICNAALIVVMGKIALKLNELAENIYTSGSVINISAKTKLNISNQFDDVSEVLLIKI